MNNLSIWPTKKRDLQIAEKVVHKYSEINEGAPLSFFEVRLNENEAPDVRISDWLKELANEYRSLYGYEQGELITRLVINQYMLRGQTLH